MSNVVIPDKTWTKEDIDQFVQEHQIDLGGETNHMKKLAIIKKWSEKATEIIPEQPPEDNETEPVDKKARVAISYFDLDRSRVFCEMEIRGESKKDMYDEAQRKEAEIKKKLNIEGDKVEVITQSIDSGFVRMTMTIPTAYVHSLIEKMFYDA